jgi:sodium-dependent dicarboxylate transporter 2/3/5
VPGWADAIGAGEAVHDATVAIAAALALFLLPSGRDGKRLLDASVLPSIPWDVCLLVGGGFAIAKAFAATGLASWMGGELAFIGTLPLPAIVLLVVLVVTFVTEINSNTATASTFLPVLAAVASASHTHPYLLMIPATFACSLAFMLPAGTGPNAVIFASGRVTIPEMARAGLWLNFIGVAVLSLVMILFGIPLLGISLDVPPWAGGR